MSLKEEDWRDIAKIESFGRTFFGVRIQVQIERDPNLPFTEEENRAAQKAQQAILTTLESEYYRTLPEVIDLRAKERAQILWAFNLYSIFVEQIPNEYAPADPYFRHFPWYWITTPIGRFKVGPRKRVYEINWTETLCQESAEALFPESRSTKIGRMMHVWHVEDLIKTVSRIVDSYEKRVLDVKTK